MGDFPTKGINWNPDISHGIVDECIRDSMRIQEQARDLALEEYEKDWNWRDAQSELLEQVLEAQQALIEGSEKSYKAAKWAAIIAGIGVFTTIVTVVLPMLFSIFLQ